MSSITINRIFGGGLPAALTSPETTPTPPSASNDAKMSTTVHLRQWRWILGFDGRDTPSRGIRLFFTTVDLLSKGISYLT
jgi:hypothetical protein